MITALYADGGIIGSTNPSLDGGTFAWCLVDEVGERIETGSGVITPAEAHMVGIENNLTEYLAVVRGLQALPRGWSGHVCSDNKNALYRLFHGWAVRAIPSWLIQEAHAALKRLDVSNIRPILHDGHPTKAQLELGKGKRGNPVSEHNVWCDKECQRLAKEFLRRKNLPLMRYQVKGPIVIVKNIEVIIEVIVDAKSEEEAIDAVQELYQRQFPDDFVDWDNDEDSDDPEATLIGPVPEDQMLLKLPAAIAPQLPGFERRAA